MAVAREPTYASAVVVSVTPKQPSFFAGELFECTITFTNTNVARRPMDHRRSLSTPRRVTSLSGLPASAPARPARLGMVGTKPPSLVPGNPTPRRATYSSRPEAERRAEVPAMHPHARQKSVVAYQVEDLSQAFGLTQTPNPAAVIASPHPDLYASQNEAMDEALRESISTWAGDSLTEHASQSPLFPRRDALPLGHEKLLWAFAQVGGTMELERTIVRSADFDQLRLRLARGELPSTPASPASTQSTPRTLGGGELSYDAEYEAGSIDFESGARPTDMRASHVPAVATMAALLFGAAGSRRASAGRHQPSGSTFSDIQTRTLLSRTLPTYSTPPSMLGVDMELAPGESRSFTLALPLPADLPPSFHGQAVHFDYYLTIGTNRVDARVRGMQQSRLLHIPIRVYNHVSPGAGIDACFDMLHPIVLPHADATVEQVGRARPERAAEREALSTWAQQLLCGGAAGERTDVALPPTCMDAVQDLAQRAGKVTYDIAKDGQVAAVLTVARAKYRLGDAVHVIVRMNELHANVRVVRVAAALESHEEVDASLALLPPGRTQRMTRQVYATHHENTLDTRQTSMLLTIPSGATPEFMTSGIRHRWSLRVSLLTESADDGTQRREPPPHLVQHPDAYSAEA
ncbi:Golgi membrane exchange factor (Ric1p-Rgp1p) subunit [Malassezia caprae]|uniref:Golgi membrane exchange factor (Ric1p-Rgp1p) subunit n=1 Tax=Malassezia caprae TaxID=1381934 RepID=A0AAF0EBA9_9BASI|nr:Golgi membrane exchange factor (Ric1p-Rgp1p) subunit [Malassezia caprae]